MIGLNPRRFDKLRQLSGWTWTSFAGTWPGARPTGILRQRYALPVRSLTEAVALYRGDFMSGFA